MTIMTRWPFWACHTRVRRKSKMAAVRIWLEVSCDCWGAGLSIYSKWMDQNEGRGMCVEMRVCQLRGLRMDAWVKRWDGMGVRRPMFCPQAYRACVLSSIGSPLLSCWPSASGRLPFSVASLSARPRIRGNSMKSYTIAPRPPPIMGPTQYTQWLTKFLTITAGAKDLAGFIPAPV